MAPVFFYARGAIFALVSLVTAFLGSIFILVPCMPLMLIRPTAWRYICDHMIGFYLSYPVSMLHFLYSIRVHVSGDAIDPNQPGNPYLQQARLF